MRLSQKAARIAMLLDELYPHPAIPLKHQDPFTLLIAVLLSAQCTDARVNQITPILFARAHTPAAMAELPVEVIEQIIKPCGLSATKARAIHQLSKRLVEEFDGIVPADIEVLETFPGVGHKTASVVMAQAFGVPAFPVDTHIHRCAQRWGLTEGKNVVQTERDLKRLFPEEKWIKLHLQIIYFAREYCQARKHDVKACPICKSLKGLNTKAQRR